MKKCIVFDLDDTLIPSSQGYEHAYRSIGIDSQSKEFRMVRHLVKDRLPKGHTSCHHRWLYFKAFLEHTNQFSPRKLGELASNYETALAEFIKADWEQKQRRLFYLKLKQRAQLAIVTNENLRSQMLKLKVIDPEGELFPLVISSEEFGVEKPGMVLFEQMAQRLGSAAAITMVGNEVASDLAPAKKLGWRTVLMQEYLTELPQNGFDVSYRKAEDLWQEVLP